MKGHEVIYSADASQWLLGSRSNFSLGEYVWRPHATTMSRRISYRSQRINAVFKLQREPDIVSVVGAISLLVQCSMFCCTRFVCTPFLAPFLKTFWIQVTEISSQLQYWRAFVICHAPSIVTINCPSVTRISLNTSFTADYRRCTLNTCS